MCETLKVSRSGYYDYLSRNISKQAIRHEYITQKASESYFQSQGIYGYRKVHRDLLAEGIECCAQTVRTIMSEIGLFSKRKRKYVTTTDSKHCYEPASNILCRDFTAEEINSKWVSDITYIPTKKGWLYLAVVIDLCSRRIVGWSMSDKINCRLVIDALQMALTHRQPDGSLIFHSDRGVQYAAQDFQDMLENNNIICSMSRKGNCWDNACSESFFASFKGEWIDGKDYQDHESAKKDIFKYIEMFYNNKRRHASLGYVSPAEYEKMRENKEQQAA